MISERPLQSQGGIDECVTATSRVFVEDEIVADFHFGADTQVDALKTLDGVEVLPELGFGEDDQLTMSVRFLTAPKVDETAEGAGLVCKCESPYTSELEAGIGISAFVALEVLLVHKLYRVGLGKVGRVSVPGGTNESCMLDSVIAAYPSVKLHMGSEG